MHHLVSTMVLTSLNPGWRSLALVGTELLGAVASRVLGLLPHEEVFDLGNLVFQRHKLLLRYVLLLLIELH